MPPRFGYDVEDRGYLSPCWISRARTDRHGYVQANRKIGRGSAHRLAWETIHGSIPEGYVVDHLCRVRNCVNPEHLEPVTRAENLRRGRKASLRREDVLAIRADPRLARIIATEYGVHARTIYLIRSKRIWADVE